MDGKMGGGFVRRWPLYAAVLLAACFMAANLVWLFFDRTPVEWDDGWNLLVSNYYYRRLSGVEVRPVYEFWRQYPIVYHAATMYPPFFRLSSAPLYFAFGFSPDVGVLTNFFFYLLAVYSAWVLAKRLFCSRTAFLACFMVSTSPLFLSLSRFYMLDFALSCLVFSGIVFYVLADNFSSRFNTAVFALLAGLGTMTKLQYPFLVLAPVLFLFVWANLRGRFRLKRKQVENVIMALCIYLVLVLPWISRNVDGILAGAEYYVHGNVSVQSLFYYVVETVNGVSLFYFMIFLVSAGAAVYGVWNRRSLDVKSAVLMAMALFVASTILIYVFSVTINERRYILPAVPATSFVGACGITGLKFRGRDVGGVILFAVVVLGLFQVTPYTIDYSLEERNLALDTPIGSVRVVPYSSQYLHKPWSEDWRIMDVLAAVKEGISEGGGNRRVCTNAVLPKFNDINLQMYSYWQRVPVSFMVLCPGDYTPFDFVIAKEGDTGRKSTEAVASRLSCDGNYTVLKSFSMPDGSLTKVYRRKAGID